jgi:hypothetical protein
MGYTFARVGAVLQMKVEDYTARDAGCGSREKSGKVNELLAHLKLTFAFLFQTGTSYTRAAFVLSPPERARS